MNGLSAKKSCSREAAQIYNFADDSMPGKTERLCALPLRRRSVHFRIESEDRPRSHWSRGRSHGPTFSAGEPVQETGIYEVIHHGAHRSAHEVVMLSGDAFPPCDTCAHNVRFRLVRTAPYIFQDEDFEEQE